jgi:hypothetical protein
LELRATRERAFSFFLRKRERENTELSGGWANPFRSFTTWLCVHHTSPTLPERYAYDINPARHGAEACLGFSPVAAEHGPAK